MRIILGLVSAMVGAVIVSQARRLATRSAWPPFFQRMARRQRFLEGERTACILLVFWRVCGALWIISGVAMLFGYGSRIS